MVCPGLARIHASQLLQVSGGFELAHTAPPHDRVPRVVDGVAIAGCEDRTRDPREDGLAHLSVVQLLDGSGWIKASIIGYNLPDRPFLERRQQEGAHLHACHQTCRHRLCNTVIALHMSRAPGKAMSAGEVHIVCEGCRVDGLQEGERTLIQTDCPPVAPSACGKHFAGAKVCPGGRAKTLHILQPSDRILQRPAAAQQVQGAHRVFPSDSQHQQQAVCMTARP